MPTVSIHNGGKGKSVAEYRIGINVLLLVFLRNEMKTVRLEAEGGIGYVK